MATQQNQSKDKRYSLDCRQAGEGCSLKLSGTYDEVLDAGTLHGIKSHGMKGDESKVREDIKGYIKEDTDVGSRSFGSESRSSGQQPRPS